MAFKFADRPATEIYVNIGGGISIAQDVPHESEKAIVTFGYQDIPALIDALKQCAAEAEKTLAEGKQK